MTKWLCSNKNAVAESFGYFFDEEGKVVYKIPRIGLQLKTYKKFPMSSQLRAAKRKQSHSRIYENAPKQTWLITDEAAANEILKG